VEIRNQDMAIFDAASMNEMNGSASDVFPGNLIVAFPGKASSMLRLGELVATRVMALQEVFVR
jgi:hypothetical protein